MEVINIDALKKQKHYTIFCVYFLFNKGKLVYIGKTKNLYARLNHHTLDRLRFDRFSYVECSEIDLDKLEKININHYKPRYNQTWRPLCVKNYERGIGKLTPEVKEHIKMYGLTGRRRKRKYTKRKRAK